MNSGAQIRKHDAALTPEAKRRKVLLAQEMAQAGYSKEVINRRVGNTKPQVLKQWADELGMPWVWRKGKGARS